ncbi:MAG: hypothetical protein AABX11_05020, partial [Nanoarchaeota archaeon]
CFYEHHIIEYKLSFKNSCVPVTIIEKGGVIYTQMVADYLVLLQKGMIWRNVKQEHYKEWNVFM